MIGALNLITRVKRQQAVTLGKNGAHVSPGHDALSPPFQLKMLIEPDDTAPMPFVHDGSRSIFTAVSTPTSTRSATSSMRGRSSMVTF